MVAIEEVFSSLVGGLRIPTHPCTLLAIAEPFNCHKSLLWEGFVTPICAESHISILDKALRNRKLDSPAIEKRLAFQLDLC